MRTAVALNGLLAVPALFAVLTKLGVYAVRATVDGRTWDGVANIGVRPTLGLRRCLLETHVIGDCPDLYGETVSVVSRKPRRSSQTRS